MKKSTLRIAIAQINSIVGDLEGNSRKIIQFARMADEAEADIVCFPELALTGYPPEDLLLKNKFVVDNLKSLKQLSKAINNITVITGFVDKLGPCLYNAAAIISGEKVRGVYHKMLLPNYGVFDEKRYFSVGKKPLVWRLGSLTFGVNICEDIWFDHGPAKLQAAKGAKLILNINASPYHMGKIKERERVLRKQAKSNRLIIAYTNLVGGQDELVFDGQSMVIDSSGKVLARAESFKEDLLILDLPLPGPEVKPRPTFPRIQVKKLGEAEEVYRALTLGLRDYVSKNGFQKVLIGLSGGIDSALVAALAADALGADNVRCVFMPSRFSSLDSKEDAGALAKNLGITLLDIPIEEMFKSYLSALDPHFAGKEKNIAEENLQARIRGNILMALSNKFGWIVLTTGNKSEMSTGYATLYGDMAGGFAVIKDVPKGLVYKLCHYRNSLNKVIPERIFTKAPTAELKENQKDSDTLGSYDVLDKILKAYVEEDKDASKIASAGFPKELVTRVLNMVDKSEYKRRQSPPGIKITPKSFGRDRRMPITNRYRG
jgi:NAD+ synthase (glutamine-hydrolysing)